MSNKFGSLSDALNHFEENSGGNNKFFQLKNDRDTAVVRFLHTGEEDLDWYIVHAVQIGDKKRYVKCTQEGDCPLCGSGNKPQLKLFLQLMQKGDDEGVIRTWERGQKFISKVLEFISKHGDLCSQNVEIERQGKAGDTNTDYKMYALKKDDKTLGDLPERQQLLGENGFVMEKSYEDMVKIAQGRYSYEPVEPTPRQETRSGSDIF